MSTLLPYSPSNDLKFWVDEQIWGHRIYDEQTPWLTFMEFINIAEAQWSDNPELCLVEPFSDTGQSQLRYHPYHRLHLRNLLFKNPYLNIYLQSEYSDDMRWDKWMRDMHNGSELKYKGCNKLKIITSAEKVTADNCEFYYLKERFASFSDFAKVVEFLRSSALEMNSNKRWSSKFVFPFGRHCLYEDLEVNRKPSKDPDGHDYEVHASSDRRFFARTGEILYLMLSRSGKSSELRNGLEKLIFKKNSQWDTLARLLQPGEKSEERLDNPKSGGYLPYLQREEYVALADDWLRLFESNMPAYDVLPHLVRLAGLHLIRYFLNRSCETIGVDNKIECVLEIMAPRKTIIRELASQTFNANNGLSQQALKTFLNDFEVSPEYQQAMNDDNYELASKLIQQRFHHFSDDTPTPPKKQIENLWDEVLKRHKQHLYKVHSGYAKEIGLASSRGSRRLRYAPTDEFLESLVLATVPVRMEFQEFLQLLYDRYKFIIGDQQATSYIESSQADKEAFHQNAERLEARLKSIGLLQRLSDACAYVLNPYGGSHQ